MRFTVVIKTSEEENTIHPLAGCRKSSSQERHIWPGFLKQLNGEVLIWLDMHCPYLQKEAPKHGCHGFTPSQKSQTPVVTLNLVPWLPMYQYGSAYFLSQCTCESTVSPCPSTFLHVRRPSKRREWRRAVSASCCEESTFQQVTVVITGAKALYDWMISSWSSKIHLLIMQVKRLALAWMYYWLHEQLFHSRSKLFQSCDICKSGSKPLIHLWIFNVSRIWQVSDTKNWSRRRTSFKHAFAGCKISRLHCQNMLKDLDLLWYIDTPSAAPFPAPLVASLQFSRRPVGCPEPTQCRIRFLMTSHHMSAQYHSAQYHEMCCWGRHAQWSRLADIIAAQGKNSTVMDQSAFVRKRPTIVFWVRQLESRSVDLNWILMGLILYNVWICLELSGYPLQTDPYPKASRSNPPSGHELTPPPSAWRSPSTAFQSWEPPGAGRRWGNGNWQIERAK